MVTRLQRRRSLTFGGAAPANAELWFSGNCNVQVRDTATSAWRSARVVGVHANHFVEHTQSFRVTVRPGATSIQFRFVANAWYDPGHGCQLSNPIVKVAQRGRARREPLFTWDAPSGSWAVRTMSHVDVRAAEPGHVDCDLRRRRRGRLRPRRPGRRLLPVGSPRPVGGSIQSLVGWTPAYQFGGTWSRGYDQFIVGDFDSDGFCQRPDALGQHQRQLVDPVVQRLPPDVPTSGSYSAGYNTIVVGDWDGDGRSTTRFIWSTATGFWVVHSFSGFTGTFRGSGRWTAVYDRAYAGDWDRDRARDDLIVWDDDTGRVVVQSFASFKPTFRRARDVLVDARHRRGRGPRQRRQSQRALRVRP